MDEPKQPSLAQRLVGIGVRKSYAYMLAAGERTPSLGLALEIESKLGVPTSAWPLPKADRSDQASAA